jgi:hypothetical protein
LGKVTARHRRIILSVKPRKSKLADPAKLSDNCLLVIRGSVACRMNAPKGGAHRTNVLRPLVLGDLRQDLRRAWFEIVLIAK